MFHVPFVSCYQWACVVINMYTQESSCLVHQTSQISTFTCIWNCLYTCIVMHWTSRCTMLLMNIQSDWMPASSGLYKLLCYLQTYLLAYLFIYLFIYFSYLLICSFIPSFVHPFFVYLFHYLFVYLFIISFRLFIYWFVYEDM